MIDKALSNKIIFGFLIVITIINLIQSAFTELIFDESYYWYFSQNLSWGYFDHPPMVALMVKIGSFFSNGELGVRLAAPFLYAGNVLLLWLLIDDEKKHKYTWLFVVFTSSIGLFVAYGFMILPDTPLLFFSLMFLWAYKRFLTKNDLISTLVLGFSMAAVMYCKYHGILLIGFVLLSNLSLLKSSKFWLATIISLILYVPHLYWLYEVDFAPIQYHLVERANSAYKIDFTTHYLLNCIAVAGIAFPLMYWAFYKTKSKDKFDRALKFLGYGVFIFFLFSSFSRRTQAQWVILIVIPLILFSLRYAFNHTKYRKWLFGLSAFAVVLILYLRIALIYQPISPINYEAYGNKEWTANLKNQIGDIPAVFHNSYRDASMYAFYTGATVFSSADVNARQSQYDFDSSEYKVRHQKVAFLTGTKRVEFDSVIKYTREFRHHTIKGKFIDDYVSYRKMKCFIDSEEFKGAIPQSFQIAVYNPYNENIAVKDLPFEGVSYNFHNRIEKSFPLIINTDETQIRSKDTLIVNAKIPDTVAMPETVFFRVGITEQGLGAGFQGEKINIE
ncbi:glycosyltransferase family 39 protein [Galbibacter sp. EGI 63066]|uniref:ArnT family glycosyltransferase n=1 Tax=Galbibacter sp. EGI 63066 TaxID=2993559 RepID=UPI002249050C|nr:glycosyltransferase family 39 protein [Galbibacter sp. EGI 63066]MCX2678815.1 glycosyltransferase family 39 protein [Galbibacter sp. EGI 63066]